MSDGSGSLTLDVPLLTGPSAEPNPNIMFTLHNHEYSIFASTSLRAQDCNLGEGLSSSSRGEQ